MKKIAISQSNYIPWKGYFDLINSVDEFTLYDDAQYTRRDWRNRNKIKTPQGLQWLTIPVDVKGKYFQKINETKISDKGWGVKHWQQIKQNYAKAKNFKKYKDIFEELYLSCKEEYLSEINHKFIIAINQRAVQFWVDEVLYAELVLSALKLTNVEIGNINDSVIKVLAVAEDAG
jgi:hypothetical protein